MDTIYYSGNFCFFLYALSFIASTLPFTNCKCKYSKYVYSWRLKHWMKNTLHTLISFKVVEFQLWNNIAISRINAHTNTHFNFNIWEKKKCEWTVYRRSYQHLLFGKSLKIHIIFTYSTFVVVGVGFRWPSRCIIMGADDVLLSLQIETPISQTK